MATKALPEPAPLDVLLAAIPSLPRPILSQLTARMIERLDELDPDPDLEPEEDRCEAGEDRIAGGPAIIANALGYTANPSLYCVGMDEDMEREQMSGDVPNCRVFALEPDPATGERPFLGWSNLSPHFQSSRKEREA